MKKLIILLNPIHKNLSEEYYIKGLKLFRKIIEMENKNTILKPSADWETSDYEEFSHKI